MYALEKYCNEYTQDIDVENYNQVFDFLQGFFDCIDYDVHTIDLKVSTIDDINNMMKFQNDIVKKLQKKETLSHDPEEQKICTSKKLKENSSNEKQDTNKCGFDEIPILHIEKSKFKEHFEEIGVDVEIAYQTYALLSKSGAQTLQEITNNICEGQDPDDFNNETTPLKIEFEINKLYMNDYLDFNNQRYELQDSFIALARGEGA